MILAPPRRMAAPELLIVDDDEELCALLTMRFESRGFSVECAGSARDARSWIAKKRFDAVLLDLRLPDAQGLTVLIELRARQPALPIIVLSAHASAAALVDAMELGAFAFFTKPFDEVELMRELATAVGRADL